MKFTTFGWPMKHITAAEANRNFSRLLKEVQTGEVIVVTSHGKPVATIEAYSEQPSNAEEDERRKVLVEEHVRRLSEQPVLDLGKFQRDWAYDD